VNRNVFPVVLGLSALVVLAGAAAGIYYAVTGRNHSAPTTPPPEPPVTVNDDHDRPPPSAKGPKLTGAWDSKVMRGKDPESGAIQIGLSGRFLVTGVEGSEQQPLTGDVTVDVYDLKPSDTSIEPKLLEEWLIESENLPAFGKQEKDGFVLNLKLPWSSYRPDLTSVKLAIKFKLAHGPELTHEETVSLDHSALQATSPDGVK
jgi:hypothetical protein